MVLAVLAVLGIGIFTGAHAENTHDILKVDPKAEVEVAPTKYNYVVRN